MLFVGGFVVLSQQRLQFFVGTPGDSVNSIASDAAVVCGSLVNVLTVKVVVPMLTQGRSRRCGNIDMNRILKLCRENELH